MRAILGRHAQPDAAGRAGDPTLLVPAGTLRRALEPLAGPAQRALAHDYVRLWARTFRTLARHLRGRPERALALFAEEVYPFLRGDRRAARVERLGAHEARVLLPADLPAEYHAGLLEAFVGLSGARAVARPEGGAGSEAFAVAFRVAPGDRLARAAQSLAALRVPLLLCAVLSAAVGVAFGAAAAGEADLPLAGAVVLGVLAAQAGANALHDLRRPAAGPFHPVRLGRPALRAIAAGAYAAAAACGALAVAASGPLLLAFVAAGLALGLLYARVRGQGLGPAVAGLTFGALVPAGAAYAMDGDLASSLVAAGLAAPLGLMAAALLLLDNMADRPLDEAGGQRTLAVRLGGAHQATAFAGLVACALAWLAATSWPWFSPFPMAAAALLALPAGWLAVRVARNADDPRALGAARLAALLLLLAVALVPLAFYGTVAA